MFKRHKGSLTVEAVLILPIFIAAILFISYFIKAHIVQDVVQDALAEAVVEVSSLSYPYYLSGGLAFKNDVHGDAEAGMAEIGNGFDSILDLIESVGDPSAQTKEGDGSITPQKMFRLAKLYAVDQGVGYAEDTIARELILSTMGNVLSAEGKDVIQRMDALGIKNGLDGFDFSGSVFYGEDDVLDIQVTYQLSRVDPFGFIRDVTLKNRVVCRAWTGGVDIDNDGGVGRVKVPPNITVGKEDPLKDVDRAFRTCYIIRDSQVSGKYHLYDCPNLRVRGDPTKRKTVVPIQVPFIKQGSVWKPEGSVDYQGRGYDFCGNCQAGIIRMKN